MCFCENVILVTLINIKIELFLFKFIFEGLLFLQFVFVEIEIGICVKFFTQLHFQLDCVFNRFIDELPDQKVKFVHAIEIDFLM